MSSFTPVSGTGDFAAALSDAGDKLVVVYFTDNLDIDVSSPGDQLASLESVASDFGDELIYLLVIVQNQDDCEEYSFPPNFYHELPCVVIYKEGAKVDQIHGPTDDILRRTIRAINNGGVEDAANVRLDDGQLDVKNDTEVGQDDEVTEEAKDDHEEDGNAGDDQVADGDDDGGDSDGEDKEKTEDAPEAEKAEEETNEDSGGTEDTVDTEKVSDEVDGQDTKDEDVQPNDQCDCGEDGQEEPVASEDNADELTVVGHAQDEVKSDDGGDGGQEASDSGQDAGGGGGDAGDGGTSDE